MCVIEVNRPDATMFVKRAVAVELYHKGNASIGFCADLADMAIEDFMQYLGERKISIFHFESPESFDREYARCPK